MQNLIKLVKRHKVALGCIGVILLFSPLFAWAAEEVGYSEPLENVADRLEARETPINRGFLPDYVCPGVPFWLGTLISGVLGVGITFGFALLLAKLLQKEKHNASNSG
ncbi:MAG: metal transporter [Candidatus Korarchaeota archaeon]|nr:metal transporter [Candidatus Korarchaeota archaeon]NIU84865.1 metal transporter [Candidatus Thorarchaeota archaeon]NIW14902.1 metal transporter [Candidatus Thorarchaeota archaeon]NIW52539.1 metal transporter [Candidatus Korarchaeota archaeon]